MFQNQNDQNVPDWKKKTYLIGSFVGAGLGFVSAYFLRGRLRKTNRKARRQFQPVR